MLAWLLPSLLLAAPEMSSPKIVSVSMFKNGYAFLTREIPLKGTTTNVVEIPQASLGTLWFWANGGAIESITSVDERGEKEVDNPAANYRDLLAMNVGKQVVIELRNPDNHVTTYSGNVLGVSPELCNLELETLVRIALPISGIHTVRGKDKDSGFVYSNKIKQPTGQRYYQIKVSGGAQKITMLSLERGATWSPAYAVDITDPKKLTLVAKATTMNDLADFTDVRARLITGFPNVMFRDFIEPLTSGMSIDQWAGAVSPGGFGGGGGGRGRQSDAMSQNAYAPARDEMPDWSGVPQSGGGGESLGDLFFYDLPKFSLKKNARRYEILFRAEADYEHVYCWDVADNTVNNVEYRETPVQATEDIWHALRFINTANQPLTTAPATILEKGEMVGQSQSSYVPRGAEAELRVNKSLDVQAEQAEEELSRERGAIKNPAGYPIFDLVTLKGTLVVKNMRPNEVKVCIKKALTGELISAALNPIVKKTAKGLRQANPVARLDWTQEVASGKKLEITYTYKLYVRSQN